MNINKNKENKVTGSEIFGKCVVCSKETSSLTYVYKKGNKPNTLGWVYDCGRHFHADVVDTAFERNEKGI